MAAVRQQAYFAWYEVGEQLAENREITPMLEQLNTECTGTPVIQQEVESKNSGIGDDFTSRAVSNLA